MMLGLTFPGINPDQLEYLKQKKSTKAKDLVLFPDPQLEIEKVTSTGEVTLRFNQNMLVPEKVDFSLLSKVVNIYLTPDQDSEAKIYGLSLNKESHESPLQERRLRSSSKNWE